MSDYAPSILLRAIQPDKENQLSVEAAQGLIDLSLSDQDLERVNHLASLARDGTLSDEERTELDEYEDVACMLELLQSKARLVLKKAS